MERTLTAALLLGACDGGLDPMVPPEQTVIGEETPLVAPPDGAPDTDDPGPPPSEDCYADFSYAVDFLTQVTGIDVFDSVDTTRVLYQERDEGNDGSVDITVTYDYDASGWLVAKTTDEEGRGTLLETWTHDDEGRILVYIEDQSADGIAEYTADRAYDLYGGLAWVSVDEDGDGGADLVIAWTRDPTGDALTQDIDSDGDGVLDFSWDFTYDSLGRQIVGLGDKDADTSVDVTATTAYTDPVLEIGTTNMDAVGSKGAVDEILAFERDALGRPLWEATDEQADGVWDVETITTWDATLGLVLSIETFIADTPGGAVHQTFSSTYDEIGRRSSFHEVLDVGGTMTDKLSSWSFKGSCP